MRRMTRIVPTLAAIVAIPIALASPARAYQAPTKPVEPKELTISPAAAPVPAFRYRLFPVSVDRTPGNAVPMYLRLTHEFQSSGLQQINEKHEAWITKASGPLPGAEAHKFLDQFESKLRHLGIGARRAEADWAYPLAEQKEDAISILLPDAQGMRTWGRLLQMQIRLEIEEGKFPEAARLLESNMGFARHVANAPFTINALIGAAIAHTGLAEVETWIGKPGSPNLYWALTALPRPLIPLRDQVETEQRISEFLIPELAATDRVRTDAECSVALIRLVERVNELTRQNSEQSGFFGEVNARPAPLDLARLRADAPKAREFLTGRGIDAATMSDDRAALASLVEKYRELRDTIFLASYLPFDQSSKVAEEGVAASKAVKDGPLALFAAIMPGTSIRAVQRAEVRVDRRVAALRVVEAIRLHAAAHGGKLPDALAEVTIVPIPVDPATGKAFEYRREGDAARLTGPPDEAPSGSAYGASNPAQSIDYKITLRK